MRSSLVSLSGWGLLTSAVFLATGSNAQDDDGPHEVPTTANFLRRMGGVSVVVGDYIYFDGGELSERGFNVTGSLTNLANATLSIDLSKSWSPSDVEIIEAPRPDEKRVMSRQHVLSKPSSNTFYIWGGSRLKDQTLQDPAALWKFTADGSGGGKWSEETDLANQNRFEELERTFGGAFASTPKKGFIFGGITGPASDPDPKDRVSGYITFDFDSKEWARDSRGPYTESGTIFGGSATFVPNFGPNGVIVILGGVNVVDDSEYLDFTNIHFIDPVTEQWFTQKTSGDAPDDRTTQCVVGVSGHNGTFEIFVYGGEIRNSFKTKRDMYALSLPGFRWTRLPDSDSTERRDHSCSVVGKRQMLSWGGLNSSTGGHEGHWNPQDPFPNGIGIFDLSEWAWKDNYDADADSYETHNSIMTWYNNGGLNTVDWTSSEVEALFTSEESGSPGDGDGNDDNKDEKNGGGSAVAGGTIAGAVIGGIAGLALGAGLVWFCLRRRRNKAPTTTPTTPAMTAAELDQHDPSVGGTPKPPPGSAQPYHADSQYSQGTYAPVPQQQTAELMASGTPVEMADTSRSRY